MIVSIIKSPLKIKRYRIVMQNGKTFDFGFEGGSTYIDHKDKSKREAYLARHLANKKEKYLIDNNIPSAALFSAKLLWGSTTSLKKNIEELNREFSKEK